MKKNKLFVLIAIIIGLGLGHLYAINFYPLPYGASFTSMDVLGAATMPINVAIGDELDITVTAIAPFDVKELKVRVLAIFKGVTINFPIEEQDVHLTDKSLPMQEGEHFKCNIKVPILSSFPPLLMRLYIILEGQNEAIIAGGGIDIIVAE